MHNDTIVAETPRDSEGNPIPDEDINNKMFVVVRNTKSAQNNLVSKKDKLNLRLKSDAICWVSCYSRTSIFEAFELGWQTAPGAEDLPLWHRVASIEVTAGHVCSGPKVAWSTTRKPR